jgi:hypothetical protein
VDEEVWGSEDAPATGPQDMDGDGVFDTLDRPVGARPVSAPASRPRSARRSRCGYDEQVVIGMLTK